MGRMKDLVIEMVEMKDDGYTVAQIADHTGLPMDVVFDILRRYSWLDEDESDTMQMMQ